MRGGEEYYSRLARSKGFPARSVFKLQQMQARFRLLRPGSRVLDLGASPGSWSQYCLQQVGAEGVVVGVDLNEPAFEVPRGGRYHFLRGDIFSAETERRLLELGPYDLVLSDAAPLTSGSGLVDARRSLEIASRALQIAVYGLKQGGTLVVKVFQGGEEKQLLSAMGVRFQRARAFKPEASRRESRELYYLGFGCLGKGEKKA
jgi:23S rRNA (uridine2552-2'-O)-methyltransferase